MTTPVPKKPIDLILINIWSFSLGKTLVQKGVLQRSDIISELQQVKLSQSDPCRTV